MRPKPIPTTSHRTAPYTVPHKSQHPEVGILGNTKVKDAASQLVVSIKRTMTASRDKTEAAKTLLSLSSAPVLAPVYASTRLVITQSTNTAPITTATHTLASPSERAALTAVSANELPESSFIPTPPEILTELPEKYSVARTALAVGGTGSGLVLAAVKDAGYCYLLYLSSTSLRKTGVKQIPSGLTTRALERLHITEKVRAAYEATSLAELTSM